MIDRRRIAHTGLSCLLVGLTLWAGLPAPNAMLAAIRAVPTRAIDVSSTDEDSGSPEDSAAERPSELLALPGSSWLSLKKAHQARAFRYLPFPAHFTGPFARPGLSLDDDARPGHFLAEGRALR